MKISCYGAAFNVIKYNFKIEEAVSNFTNFFDEVVCTTVPCEDDTWSILKYLESQYKNFKVIYSNIQTTGNNFWDGQVRTEALKLCSNEIRVAVDYDERFVLSNKQNWIRCAQYVDENKQYMDGIFVPSVDLWGNEKLIRSDRSIRLKFRIHNSNVKKKGVVNFAKLKDNLFDIEKSDGTEPTDEDGNLCKFFHILTPEDLDPKNAFKLKDSVYSLHYGYLDFERKYNLANEFWNKVWTDYQLEKEVKLETPKQMSGFPVIEHGLPLI